MLRSPVFVVCQGRTGGTMFSDLLARLPDTRYLLEPLHPRLLRNVQGQPIRTAEKLRHGSIQPFPNRGYLEYPFRDLVNLHGTQHSQDITVCKWLRYLVDGAEADGVVPVFKVCRLFGRLRLLREEFPRAAIVHLWRGLLSQRRSYQSVGFPGDYFGDCSGYGLAPDQYREAWERAMAEGTEVADVSVSYEVLTEMPHATLYHVFRGVGMSGASAASHAAELYTLVRSTA